MRQSIALAAIASTLLLSAAVSAAPRPTAPTRSPLKAKVKAPRPLQGRILWRGLKLVVPRQQTLPVDKYHPGAKLLPYQPEMEALANGQ